jgi:hypothetical protein
MTYRTTSAPIGELRLPWRSLVGEILDLTPALEREFRFGQRVAFFNGIYRIGGNIKGGSSSIWSVATERDFEVYLAWRDRDGIPPSEDRPAFDALEDLLARAGAEMRAPSGLQETLGGIYRLTLDVLSSLPGSHLRRDAFRAIQLGGWGPDSAKGSAYQDGTVLMYDFALKGARRTYLGLLLHEMGHVHASAMGGAERDRVGGAFRRLVKEDAFLGAEYLLDGESRRAYQRASLEEFLAETYMVYVSHGRDLPRRISDFGGKVRKAWETVYEVFREGFEGVEYE